MTDFIAKGRSWFRKKPATTLYDSTEEFLKSLSSIVGLDQLLENFSAKLKEILDAATVYIILYEPITNRYVGKKAKGDNVELLVHLNFSRSDSLIKWLNVNRCALDVVHSSAVVRSFSIQEQELLRTTNSALIIPLIVLNRLTGAIFLNPRTNASEYTPTEIEMLSMVASQSALAIEHALTYQFQEEKLKKIFHTDKLATVGELAAGAAHEIRNPLTSIRSTIQYLRKDLPEEKRQLVDGVIEEVDRIDQVIRGLLSFSKTAEFQMTDIDIQDVLNQTVLLLDSELRNHSIDIHKHYAASNMAIIGDAAHLKQVFLNILLNGIQAMPDGGVLAITVSDNSVHHKTDAGKDVLCIRIADTGTGIPDQNLSKVFDPFFTTKETGTGLGLSISYGIISRHGGEIEIGNTDDANEPGAIVTVRLPKSVKKL